MAALERQVALARRRLTVNVLLERGSLVALIATGAWTATLLVERAFGLGIPVLHAVWAAALLAVLIAAAWTAARRVDAVRAAATLDAAAGLKERVSTALVVRQDRDPFAQAAVGDAEKIAANIHVAAHLPYRAPRLWSWALAALIASALLGLFMPNLNLLAGQKGQGVERERAAAEVERQNINLDLEDRLNKVKQLADNNVALADLTKDLEPLQMPDKSTITPEDIRREATKRLDKVADRLAERKEELKLDALPDTQRMLSRLQAERGESAAAELSKALSTGDFEGAKKALEQLQKDVEEAAAKGDPEAQQRLAQMQNQLQKLANQLAELDSALYLQKELQNKGGLSEEQAKKLAEELAKLDPKQMEKELQRQLGDKQVSAEQIKELAKRFQQQKQGQQTCQNMGKCLAQAAQALQQCQNPGSGAGAAKAASAALSDAASQMGDMEMAEQFLSEIEARMSDIREMRDSVCRGGYCRGGTCSSDKVGPQGPNYGRGIGARIGTERAPHDFTPTKAKTRPQGGTIIGQMLVDGAQVRGQATAEVREALNAAQHDAQDAVDRDLVPRQYHSAVLKYFEQLAGLIHSSQTPPATSQPSPSP